MLSIQTSNAAPANIASCLSISSLRDELAGKAYARIFTRAVIYHLGFDVFAKRFDSAPIAWTRPYTRRLRLNGGALKSTSECGSSNINQSLKKTSVTQAHLEFQLWQIDSRIMAANTLGGWTAPLAATFSGGRRAGADQRKRGAQAPSRDDASHRSENHEAPAPCAPAATTSPRLSRSRAAWLVSRPALGLAGPS